MAEFEKSGDLLAQEVAKRICRPMATESAIAGLPSEEFIAGRVFVAIAEGTLWVCKTTGSAPERQAGAQDVTLELWVSSGTTNGASFTVETGWDGGAFVSDSVDDSATKSATMHKVTATIAAADVPNAASLLTLVLTPPTHGTDAIQLHGGRLLFATA